MYKNRLLIALLLSGSCICMDKSAKKAESRARIERLKEQSAEVLKRVENLEKGVQECHIQEQQIEATLIRLEQDKNLPESSNHEEFGEETTFGQEYRHQAQQINDAFDAMLAQQKKDHLELLTIVATAKNPQEARAALEQLKARRNSQNN